MESYKGAVQTAKDAIILLEAARINMIPRVTRRLKEHERELIKAGDVFIWNEKEAKMRRWTDGRSWSASRVTGSFLTYREMEYSSATGTVHNHSNYAYKNNGLIKQSFSLATLKGDKLHLISYTTTDSYANSKFFNKTPSTDSAFAGIEIPKEVYPEASIAEFQKSPRTKKRSSSIGSTTKIPAPMSVSPPASHLLSPGAPIDSVSPVISTRHLKLRSPVIDISTSTPRISPETSTRIVSTLPPIQHRGAVPALLLQQDRGMGRMGYDSVTLNVLDRFSFRF